MMESTRLISATWIILLIAFDSFEDANSTCQRLISIEKGQNATIGCNITEDRTDTFWYIGSPTSTNPILSLANNQKSGTMYGNIRYDINSRGDMLIFNAQVEDEATYTVVIYFAAEHYQQENITVEIRVYPQQQCPEIAGCTSCSNCSRKINQTGELICSVTGSRPKLSLQWEISSVNHLQFTSHKSQSEKHDVTGTWDSYISAQYSFSKCGAFADIRCRVEDNQNLIEQSYSAIVVNGDPCPTDNPTGDSSVTDTFLQPAVIISVVVCFVLILTASFILVVSTIKNKSGKKTLQKVVSSYSESYKQHCYITLFAGVEVKKMKIDTLYVDCQCMVKWKNGSYQVMTTDELMIHEIVQKEKSVILTGDLGLGKTTFFHQMMNKWTQQEEKTFLLIYIQLNEYNYQKNIIDIVMNEIPSLHRKDVKRLLLKEPIVALIDGLSELPLPKNCNDISTYYNKLLDRIFSVHSLEARRGKKTRRENIEADLTPEELQPIKDTASEKNNDIRIRNKEMRTWVALRQTKISLSQMPVTIELVGFNEEQTNKLEKKMHNYRHQYDNNQANNQENDCSTATEKSSLLKTEIDDVGEEEQRHSQQLSKRDTAFSVDNSYIHKKNSNKSLKEEIFSPDTTVRHVEDTDETEFGRKRDNLLPYMHFVKHCPHHVPLFLSTVLCNNVCGTRKYETELSQAMLKIVEVIIDCMERHHNTKRHDSGDDITNVTLAQTIDSTFLEKFNKNIPKSVTKWEEIFGKDKLDRAFSIGLLCQATNDSVTFRYPFVSGLFCEYHLLQKCQSGNFPLHYHLKSDHFRLALVYVCGLQTEKQKSMAVNTLREKGMWDDFIDCFFKVKDPDTRDAQIGRIKRSEEITVTNVDDIYHQDNLKAFLVEYKKLNYSDGTFILEGRFRVYYLTMLQLPDFVRIVFSNVKIEENNITFIVEWMLKAITKTSSKHKIRTFQFHNCSINLNKFEQALQRQSDLSEIYIEITSGSSWKNRGRMSCRRLGRHSITETVVE